MEARRDESSRDGLRTRARATRASRRRAKISHMVASEIVRDIVEEGLQEGDQLPTEAQMLEEFDVGRASVREALRMLEAYGLISIKQGQNGGPVVAAIHPEDLARSISFYFHMTDASYGELMEARLAIEPLLARLAAEAQDPEQMRRLKATIDQEQGASLEEPEYLEHSNDFHYMISGISGNRVLDLIGRALRIIYQERLVAGALLPPEERPGVRDIHKEIGEAILAGDGDLASRLMAEHLETLSSAQFERTPELRDERVTWIG